MADIYLVYQKGVKKGDNFPTYSVKIKLKQHKLTPAQQIPRQKNRGMVEKECSTRS